MTIKQKIIEKVNSIDNSETLNEVLKLISTESEMDQIYRFTTAERNNVMEGIADAKAGRIYDQEESDKLITEWLQEKSNGLKEH